MKSTRLILALVLVAVLGFALYQFLAPNPGPRLDAAQIFKAAQAFSREVKASGLSVPPTITLRELISAGYLRASDVKALEGLEVTVSLYAEARSEASELLRAKLRDGSQMVLMTDGTVQNVK